jgi:gliding motility-associated peptidyl-prolyl isomerase
MSRNILLYSLLGIFILSCKGPEARRPIKRTSGTFIKQSIERNKKIYEQDKSKIFDLMDAKPEHTYLASNNGFWYYYKQQDTISELTPQFGDKVTFFYDVKDLNGNTILSESELGLQNYTIDQTQQELISGIRDGIKLMKQGETITFLFPSYMAYGYYGLEKKLGTNVPIQSTVTLKSINQKQENQ